MDKCALELTLSQFRTVKQLREWIWYVMDFRRSAELAWAQRTMHKGPAVRWMGFQGVKLGIAALGKNVSWYDLYVRTWPCSASGDVNRCISSKRTYTPEAWKGNVDPRAWKYAVTTFPRNPTKNRDARMQAAGC